MLKKIVILSVMILLLCNVVSVNADSKINVYIVYDRGSAEKGDIVNISIDIPAFAELFSSIVRYQYNEEYLKVIEEDESFFKLDNHSIFSSFVVNKKFDNNVLYAEMMKDTIDNGYYSSYRNNLCKLSFVMLKGCSNIEDLLMEQNIQIYLFDNNHHMINYELKIMEKIKTNWQINDLTLEYGEENLDLSEIFVVLNRKEGDYSLFLEEEINYASVGNQVLLIGLFDKITGNYQSFSKIIEIIDTKKPIVTANPTALIYDYELQSFDFSNQVTITDNYDKTPLLEINYYNKEEKKVSKSEALENLKRNLELAVGYTAKDCSNNYSDEQIIHYQLVDTTAPVITGPNLINIIDQEFDAFILENEFEVSDNLSDDILLIYSFYDYLGNQINSLKEGLAVGADCIVKIIAVDESGNESCEYEVDIKMIDKTSPRIEGEIEVTLKDSEIEAIDFKTLIKVFDNDLKEPNVACKYYGNQELSVDEFKEMLSKGSSGKIIYHVTDSSFNESFFTQTIKVFDTIPPSISANVEDGKLYESLDEITFEIVDNISSNITVDVLLNDNVYKGGKIANGNYQLVINAIDENGNKSTKTYHFVVSDKSMIENVINGNVKLKTDLYVYLIIGSMIVLLIVKVLMKKKIEN